MGLSRKRCLQALSALAAPRGQIRREFDVLMSGSRYSLMTIASIWQRFQKLGIRWITELASFLSLFSRLMSSSRDFRIAAFSCSSSLILSLLELL